MRKLMALESLETASELSGENTQVTATLSADQSGLVETSQTTLDNAKEESRKVDTLVQTCSAMEHLAVSLSAQPHVAVGIGFARSFNVAVEHMQRVAGIQVQAPFHLPEMNGHMSRVIARQGALKVMMSSIEELKTHLPR